MKKKKKKGSLELSVNSIVILIMAIALLGLGLGFIKAKFSDLNKQLVTDEPSPSAASSSEPITLSRGTVPVSIGKQFALKVSVYNLLPSDLTNFAPTVTCNNLNPGITFIQSNIKTGQVVEFAAVGSIPKTTAAGMYLCRITAGTIGQKDFVIQVS